MKTPTSTGNLFADYLLYSDGKSDYNLYSENKENVEAFIELFASPYLYCDGNVQQQYVEIKAPIFCQAKPGLSLVWESASISIADGDWYLHPAHLLQRSWYEGKNVYAAFKWADIKSQTYLERFSIGIKADGIEYVCRVQWKECVIRKYAFQWKRTIEGF